MKNEIMKTFYKIKHGYISKCFNTLFNKKKTFLSKCFISSILPDNYDTSRGYFKILYDKKSYFFLDTVFIKCLKFSFAN